MLSGVRRSIGLRLSRFRFRRSRDAVQAFTRAFSEAREVLVVMPLDPSQLLNSVMVIDLLKKTFREENLTFVIREHDQELRRMMPQSQFINMLDSDISLLYLPRSPLLQKIRRKTYDLALDLNLDFLLPSAYICKGSDARVRIGFARKEAEAFFNFQIRAGSEQAARDVYDRLAGCLQKF